MGKIKVVDLAKKMGVPEQDLLFKLKSIGVRVEGEDAAIDTDVIQAILSGKQLPQPPQREVIMRDSMAQAAAKKAPVVRRAPPPPPPSGARPPRRRAVVQKADPKIRSMPSSERHPRRRGAPGEDATTPVEGVQTQEAVEAGLSETPPATERRDAGSAEPRHGDGQPAAAHEISGQSAVDLSAAERKAKKKAAPSGETITITEGLRVRDLAEKLGIKVKDLMKPLMARGLMMTVNQSLDPQFAVEIAEDLGFDVLQVSFEEEVQLQHELKVPAASKAIARGELRAPVVTVMGHVDHGKTSLLDAIRSANVAAGESGGITQHLGAYEVTSDAGKRTVFVDTPGHEAFTQLRARGAKVTDIVVLVVAADDGVMPQTVEAIQHARAAGVPIIVAINKIDKANANPDKVKKELADHDLLVEDWGGETVSVPISALKREGIEDLLEMISLTSEILDLKADPGVPAQGVVLEARKEAGRGAIATALIQTGTLELGQAFVSGATWGRVRTLTGDRGQRLTSAGPSTPVEITGFDELPNAGDQIQVVEKESKARDIAQLRAVEQRHRDLAPSAGRMSLESLFSKVQQGEIKELGIVLKADVQGSVEVLREALGKLSTDKVKVRILAGAAGAISTNDVLLASASDAIVVGFNVRPERIATDLAQKEEVEIRSYTVIYELIDEIKLAMAGLLDPTYKEVERGRAEVREIFRIPRIGMIAGCHVVEGILRRNDRIRLLRDNVVVYQGTISSLRRFKDDASEVRSGFDCGVSVDRFQDVKPGDVLEAFVEEAVAGTL